MKKILALLLVCTMALAGLAGCGGSKYRSMEEIQSSGKIVMLTNAAFEPYEYVQGGVVSGVDPDLAQMIADELGVELEIIDMDFDLLVDALKNGKGDFIAAGMTSTPERAKQVDFSDVYVNNGLLIIVPVDTDITSPEDLVGKTIAVQEGTTADLYCTDEVEGAEVLRFKDAIAAGNSVADGKADAAVLDIKPAEGVVTNSGGALVLLDEQLTEEDMCMAVAKGNDELMAVINKVLGQCLADGTIDTLVEFHMDATT